jgi:hypothetical protein
MARYDSMNDATILQVGPGWAGTENPSLPVRCSTIFLGLNNRVLSMLAKLAE